MPRNLHSFPTRRSSDLEHALAGLLESDVELGERLAEALDLAGPDIVGHVFAQRMPARQLARSEEHTSELQSRLQLVCRLLLEKKNRHKLTILSKTDALE